MRIEGMFMDWLLPLEPMISRLRVYQVTQNWEKVRKIPVTIAPYGDRYLLLDGHHRTCVNLMKGINLIPAKVLETDRELAESIDGFLGKGVICSFRGLYCQYEGVIKLCCENVGIKNVRDYLPLLSGVRRSVDT